MPQKPTRVTVPDVPGNLPKELHDFLTAIKHNTEVDNGTFAVSEKKPTVQDMLDAGVTNADKIA